MSQKETKEIINNLYERSKKLFEHLNQPSLFEEPLKDSIIIANLGKDLDKEANIIKSLDTLDKADLLDYSMKPNGNLDTSKLKDSISNTYLESSENGSTDQKGGYITSGGVIRIGITKYKALVLKYGKIIFLNNGYMNESLVMNNDILNLETKIPIFKPINSKDIMYDTFNNYHQLGSDKDDNNYLVNINQTNTHKINLDESNFSSFVDSKIYIFLHKKVKTKNTNAPKKEKDISSAQSTQIIENKDTIIGYSSLEMSKIFLGDDFKFKGKINLLEKKKSDNKKSENNAKKKKVRVKIKKLKTKKKKKKKKNLMKKEKELSEILKLPLI